MNSKKAKLLRKSLKKGGVDWRDSQPSQREVELADGSKKRHPTYFKTLRAVGLLTEPLRKQ